MAEGSVIELFYSTIPRRRASVADPGLPIGVRGRRVTCYRVSIPLGDLKGTEYSPMKKGGFQWSFPGKLKNIGAKL